MSTGGKKNQQVRRVNGKISQIEPKDKQKEDCVWGGYQWNNKEGPVKGGVNGQESKPKPKPKK